MIDSLELAILGREATPEEKVALDNLVQKIADEEDRCFLELVHKWVARREDRKLRKTNYRAWKAKHSQASQPTQ